MAGLKGVALVSLVELHPLDPVASHASLTEGDVVSKMVGRLDCGPYSQVTSSVDWNSEVLFH